MTNTADYKKGVMQCRTCHNTFHQSDVKLVKTEHYGLEKEENGCPYCGSVGFGALEYIVTEEELIYKTGKFYANHNRELRLHMDQVENEILIEDSLLNKSDEEDIPRIKTLEELWEEILKVEMKKKPNNTKVIYNN